jgi:hypothetical protein
MFDDIPTFDAMPEPAQQQASPQTPQQGAPVKFDDIPAFDAMPDANAPTSSPAGTAARAFVQGVPAAIGAGAGAALGAGAGGIVGNVPGAIIGGLGGALVGGYASEETKNWLLQKLGFDKGNGFFSKAQQQVDTEQHPIAQDVGGTAAALTAFATGGGEASIAARVLGGGVVGAMETGQEMANNGSVDPSKLDPVKIGLAAGTGAVLPSMREYLAPAEKLGQRIGSAVRPSRATGEAAPRTPDQKTVDNAQDITTTAPGVAAENPPVSENTGAQMGANTSVRSDREYPKEANATAKEGTPGAESSPGLSTAPIPDDIAAAMAQKGASLLPEEPAPVQTGLAEQAPAQPAPVAAKPPVPAPADDIPQPEWQSWYKPPQKTAATELPADTAGLQAPAPTANPVAASGDYEHPTLPNVTVSQRYKIPYLAGSSVDGKTVYIDPRVPDTMDVNGTKIDPRNSLVVREIYERNAIDKMTAARDAGDPKFKDKTDAQIYADAHKTEGTGAERKFLRQQYGFGTKDWARYQQLMKDIVPKTEHETVEAGQAPPDLYTFMYPHEEALHLHQEGSAAPTAKEAPAAETAPAEAAAPPAKPVEDNSLLEVGAHKKELPADTTGLEAPDEADIRRRLAAGGHNQVLAALDNVNYGDKGPVLVRTKAALDELDALQAKKPAREVVKEGGPQTGGGKRDVRKTSAAAAVKKAFDDHPPKQNESDGDILQRAKAAVETARNANNGADPLRGKDGYAPRVKPAEWQFVDQAQKLLKKPTPGMLAKFKTSELSLRGTGEEAEDVAAEHAKEVQNTARIEADIAKKPDLPDAAAEAQLAKANEGATRAREDLPPFDNSDQGESKVFENQQNDLRDWVNGLSDEDYKLLASHYENGVAHEADLTSDPKRLKLQMEANLEGAQMEAASSGKPASLAAAASEPPEPVPAKPSLGPTKPGAAASDEKLSPEAKAKLIEEYNAKLSGEKPPPSTPVEPGKVLASISPTPEKTKQLIHISKQRSSGAAAWLQNNPLRKIFSPTTISPSALAAKTTIREETGVTARNIAQASARLEPMRATINALPEKERIDFQKAMETEQTPQTFPEKLQPLAAAIRQALDFTKAKILEVGALDVDDFVKNFFPHMWENQKEANEFVQSFYTKQGSTASLHKRTVPTIQDGLDAKLKLASTDPIDVTMRYLSSMHNFITQQKILQAGIDQEYVKTFDQKTIGASGHPDGSTIPLGYVELKGRGMNGRAMYAPEGWAEVYNNFYSPGFHSSEAGGRLFDAAQKTSNAVTQIELGLSAYHAGTMAREAMLSEMARGLSNIVSGDLKGGVKALARVPIASYRLAVIGKQVKEAYLDPDSASPELRKIVDLMKRSGGRMVGFSQDPTYKFSAMESYFTAWQRGALGNQLREIREHVESAYRGGANTAEGAASAVGQIGKELFRVVGRTMQTVAQPLFEHYIPALKNGAFKETLADWLAKNPTATDTEQLHAAARIGDSIDNRFGEMVQDNIFWNKFMKQSAQVMMRSYSWNVGTVREIAGGAIGAALHPNRLSMASKDYDPRAAYALSLPVIVAATSAVYQYLKTGEYPQDMSDLVAGRTGGKTQSGTPERAILPGYEKDVYGWFNNPKQEAFDKIATAPRLVYETLTNRDFKDDPIYNPADPLGAKLQQYLEHVKNSIGPISIKQMMQGEKKGSNISAAERAVAIRPAPTWISEPARIGAGIAKSENMKWKIKLSHDRSAASHYNP